MKTNRKKAEATISGIEIVTPDDRPGTRIIRRRSSQTQQDAKPLSAKTYTKKHGPATVKRGRDVNPGEAPGSTYRDDLAAAIHEGLTGLAALGAVGETEVRSFEKVALKPLSQYTGDRVKELRHRENATQAVFALHLGVSVNTVSQWERGEREVAGAAAKLLSLVEERGLAYLV